MVRDSRPTGNRARSLFSYLVLAALASVTGAWLLLIGVRAGAQGLPPPPKLFAPYQNLMPGQALIAKDAHACRPVIGSADVSERLTCTFAPEKGAFHRVDVIVFGGEIVRTTFTPHGIRVVELIGYWGRPKSITTYDDVHILQWNQQTSVLVRHWHLSLQAPVKLILVSALNRQNGDSFAGLF